MVDFVKLEFIRYPDEGDWDFAYRIKRACKPFDVQMLRPTAKTPEQVQGSVSLVKIDTENGIRYIYETETTK